MLVEPVEIVMHETVMPYLLEKIMDFLNDEDFIEINTNELVRDAFEKSKAAHKKSIKQEYKRRQDVVDEAEQRVQQKEAER